MEGEIIESPEVMDLVERVAASITADAERFAKNITKEPGRDPRAEQMRGGHRPPGAERGAWRCQGRWRARLDGLGTVQDRHLHAPVLDRAVPVQAPRATGCQKPGGQARPGEEQ